jgi:hypothetical protein
LFCRGPIKICLISSSHPPMVFRIVAPMPKRRLAQIECFSLLNLKSSYLFLFYFFLIFINNLFLFYLMILGLSLFPYSNLLYSSLPLSLDFMFLLFKHFFNLSTYYFQYFKLRFNFIV